MIRFYNLMYVDLEEKRHLSGTDFSSTKRIDLFVKNSCILDRSLKLEGHAGGITLLTNNETIIRESLERIGYRELTVEEIEFTLNVPRGISFYSAHFKIDVFKYFSTKGSDEYSLLLDSDIICKGSFPTEFFGVAEQNIPMVYYLPLSVESNDSKIESIRRIDADIKWCPWAGGEFIGGTAEFYGKLYRDICLFKDKYFSELKNDLFHTGDEMLTTIALAHLTQRGGVVVADAKSLSVVHRYWSIYEHKKMAEYDVPLIHLPGDKVFLNKVNLSKAKVSGGLMAGYDTWHRYMRLREFAKRIIGR